ncbi:MAG: GspMb/PilO family protein [Pseudomonadota bacterium]
MSEFRFPRPSDPPLALGGFVLAVGLGLGMLGLEAVAAIQDLERRIADKEALLARAVTTGPGTGQPALPVYSGATAEEARVQFQTDIQAMADAAGLEVETLAAEEMTISQGMIRMGFAINGSIPEQDLPALLVALDGARPAIMVETIALRRGRGRRAVQGPRLLPIRLELAAYADV